MPLIAIFLALLFVTALVLATPVLLVLRYRAGAARRLRRKWLATVNLMSLIVSAVTTFWVPRGGVWQVPWPSCSDITSSTPPASASSSERVNN